MRAINTGLDKGKVLYRTDEGSNNTQMRTERTYFQSAQMRAANTSLDEGKENIVPDRPHEGGKHRPG